MSTTHPVLAHLEPLDRALAAKGFPYMSQFWGETFRRFYKSGRRQIVLRCGRRGGKSSSCSRVAVLEGVYGDHKIPPGDVGIVGIVSVSRDEANQRLRTIKAILDAIGVKYKPIEGGIELVSKPIAFKVFAASISGVVGGTWICAICDEVARWKDADTGANPAKEVLASLRPTMATQPNARIFLSSSPLGSQDAHAVAFDQGETDFQCVAFAPTWLANPSISESETHTLEPDERVWKREYAALAQASALGAFSEEEIDRAFKPRAPGAVAGPSIIVIDSSGGKKDAYTWCRCFWARPADAQRECYLRFEDIDAVSGAFLRSVTAAQIVTRIVTLARKHKAIAVHGDQRDAWMLKSEFARHGVAFMEHTWTAQSKPDAVEIVRRWLREGALSLPEHETMQKELLAFEERINAAGNFSFGARGNGHDDFVALLLTAALANERGYIPPPPRYVLPGSLARPVASFNFNNGGIYGNDGPAASSRELVASMPNFFPRR